MSFYSLHSVIHPLTSCLSGVIDLSSNEVIEELNFMYDERVKYLNEIKNRSKSPTLNDINTLIRYACDLYYLCEVLFFRDNKTKLANKQLYSLVKDATGNIEELVITDSLIVEWIFKIEELCISMTAWIDERFSIYQFTRNNKVLLARDVLVDSNECEAILASIKLCIGLINKVKDLEKEGNAHISFEKLISTANCIETKIKSMNEYKSTLRILGCWVCSIGLQKEKKKTIETYRKISEFLASCLLMIDEKTKEESEIEGLERSLVNSIRIDSSVAYAKEMMGYNNNDIAYKHLSRAVSLGWKDDENLVQSCKEILGTNLPTDFDSIEQKPLGDTRYLEKGKPPLKRVNFVLFN